MPQGTPRSYRVRVVLVVEDDPVQREALSDLLRIEGFDVLVAGDGLQGEHIAAAHRVDAAVLDVDLPQLDGLTLGRRLRRRLGEDAILVVQSGRPLNRPHDVGAPFDAVFCKPVVPRELISVLR